jgi:nucleoredoxin
MRIFSPVLIVAARWCIAAGLLVGSVGAVRTIHAEIVPENPLTTTEICARLKSGSTSDDVVAALNTRRLLARPTLADEQNLRAAGASPRLIDALKSGAYTLSPFDASAARQRMTAAPAGGQSGVAANPGHMASLLRGKLVTFQNGSLKGYDDAKLAGKKYFGIYYSAHWCAPCREFTPKLVAYYQQIAAQHPEVEIVFVSSDQTPLDMQNYMKEEKMPWAALRFERKAMEREIAHYAGSGIPDLVLVDGDGKVLSDSYEAKNYVGPYKVANDLAKLIKTPAPF